METKIQYLQILKAKLIELAVDDDFLYRVEASNNWFTPKYTAKALLAIAYEFLEEDKLRKWLGNYTIANPKETIGLILAGNLPLVGFHDILCTYFCSDSVLIKPSSKDSIATDRVLKLWFEIDKDWENRCKIVERITTCDRIIATGSSSSFQYFEYYFKKFKHILRQNRSSIAILKLNTSESEIEALMDDIFFYYGLGCRNVSKLVIERGFELARIFEAAEKYNSCFEHSKYMNNYDYQRTLLLLNKIEHLSNNFLMLREDKSLFTAISVVNYEYFESENEINTILDSHKKDLQCVIGSDFIPFGHSQSPSLMDYADGVDTIQFLID